VYVEVKDLKKSYGESGSYVEVLKGVSTSFEQGTISLIQGTSGSGKSTFLNCIGGLDAANSGSIVIDGTDIVGLSQSELSRYRRETLGFIFQFYNLVPNLTVRENIQVCRYLTDEPLDMDPLLKTLGLWEHQNKFPSQLSGGQQQRTSIARALVKNPKLLLLDEPTGALDSKTSKDILVLLEQINQTYGTTMIMVTHNNAIRQMADHVVWIRDGMIISDEVNTHKVPAETLEDL